MNKEKKLDEAIAQMRAEEPREETVQDAGRRVFRKVFDAAYRSDAVGRIEGCGDFEALIPAYLEHSLTPARTALFEDHVHACVACRRALNEARGIQPRVLPPKNANRKPGTSPWLKWGLAAALAAGVALGVTGALNGLLPGQHAVRARVVSVQGVLYQIDRLGSHLVAAGSLIRNADELRTAKGSRAIFQLLDGAKVEMGERSDVSVSGRLSGISLEVERGRVIVDHQAAGEKPLLLAVGDVRVPVKRNTVLAADRGMKGTRVSLAAGSTEIEQGGRTMPLSAGEQFAGYRLQNASYVRKASLENEFAWSSNAPQYRALLDELKSVQKDIRAIPSPGLRYATNLAQHLPVNTVIYAAIPNLGGTIQQARQIFEQHLSESAVLREWWQQQPAARSGELDRALNQLSAISAYLGNEIVFAVTSNAPHQFNAPLLIAQLEKPGLEDYVKQINPAAANNLALYTNGQIVVASPDKSAVERMKSTLVQPNASGFAQTPFFQRISQSYGIGAEYLLAVDMEQMVANSVHSSREIPPGFDNAQYLLLERRDTAQSNVETRATLSFAGSRQGIASWLGAPGPMGSLDFVSPDAFVAASIVMKNPLTIMQELISYAGRKDGNGADQVTQLEQHLGVKLTDDVAALFGGDATFAIDGELLPVPSWKVAVEVYNPEQLNTTVQTIVDHFNQQFAAEKGKLLWGQEQVNGRTFYTLRNEKASALTVYYTFVDGFLLAGPEEQLLLQAIQNRENGYTLANSQQFKDQLPSDNYLNCSALLWHNPGKNVQDALKKLGSAQGPGSFLQILASSGPGLICVYGEPDRIVAATKTDFLGFNLSTLAGLGLGKPLPEIIDSRQSAASKI
ncbi:MAG TPA: FecR domain-containing protein [Bryobacteraceae bacterium]|nr:FecR domain-containing protein [Bryobacteraceae bacterium]